METNKTAVPNERAAFEDAAFNQYFLSTIMRNPNPPQPRISGCMDFIATADKTKAELCAKNSDGNYVEESLNPAWWAWQERGTAHDDLVAAAEKALDECCDLIGTDAGHALQDAINKSRGAA